MADRIGDWSPDRLARYIEQLHKKAPASVLGEELRSTRKLSVEKELELSPEALDYLRRKLGAFGGPGTGGGGGGGPVDSLTPANLFIQQTQPTSVDMLVDSLWIPVDGSGIPAPANQWQVYVGTGSGDGGNLFIQESAPSPSVDSLWIPLQANGDPVYLDDWVVYTGRGKNPLIGNHSLLIQTTLPGTPSANSLFIPLNPDLTARTPDQWRVNA